MARQTILEKNRTDFLNLNPNAIKLASGKGWITGVDNKHSNIGHARRQLAADIPSDRLCVVKGARAGKHSNDGHFWELWAI